MHKMFFFWLFLFRLFALLLHFCLWLFSALSQSLLFDFHIFLYFWYHMIIQTNTHTYMYICTYMWVSIRVWVFVGVLCVYSLGKCHLNISVCVHVLGLSKWSVLISTFVAVCLHGTMWWRKRLPSLVCLCVILTIHAFSFIKYVHMYVYIHSYCIYICLYFSVITCWRRSVTALRFGTLSLLLVTLCALNTRCAYNCVCVSFLLFLFFFVFFLHLYGVSFCTLSRCRFIVVMHLFNCL